MKYLLYQLYLLLALSRYLEHPHLHPELCLLHRCPWLLHKPVPVPCAKQSPAAKQRAKQTAKLAQKWVSLSGGAGQQHCRWSPHHTTTGHMDTGDAGHCTRRQPFVRVYWNHWLVCEKKGKNKKKLDKFQYESCMKCRCVGRWKTFLEFPCLLSTRAYHRFPYFVFYCEAQGKGKGQVIQKSLKLDINSIQSAV